MRAAAHTFRDTEISRLLLKNGIRTLEDLATDRMSEKLHMMVTYEERESRVRSDRYFALLIIDSRLNRIEQRREFFHELSHALFHPGDQETMPAVLSRYQEEQTKYLMLYLAMPLHIIEPVLLNHQSLESLQELFDVPEDMIKARLATLERERSRYTYQTKMQRREWQHRKKSLQPGEVHNGTLKILQQLKNQVGEERMSYDVTRLL